MDQYLVPVYVAYAVVSVGLIVWLARTLFASGAVFLEEVFEDNPSLAHAVNRLLVIGFYMANLGYAGLLLRAGSAPDAVTAVEVLAQKLGVLLVSLAALHFVNLYVFWRIRRRATAHVLPPPIAPQVRLPHGRTEAADRDARRDGPGAGGGCQPRPAHGAVRRPMRACASGAATGWNHSPPTSSCRSRRRRRSRSATRIARISRGLATSWSWSATAARLGSAPPCSSYASGRPFGTATGRTVCPPRPSRRLRGRSSTRSPRDDGRSVRGSTRRASMASATTASRFATMARSGSRRTGPRPGDETRAEDHRRRARVAPRGRDPWCERPRDRAPRRLQPGADLLPLRKRRRAAAVGSRRAQRAACRALRGTARGGVQPSRPSSWSRASSTVRTSSMAT